MNKQAMIDLINLIAHLLKKLIEIFVPKRKP
ncbi:hypothetical protein LCGC14_0349620 [marine sediment metagenome]|uniref:Uncharacterized protein n=1 Tax=marine sediment metagenome TaxID=412755 RepID=A0A0F9TB29_9ZZZZ